LGEFTIKQEIPPLRYGMTNIGNDWPFPTGS
jgi:hypothetical protein